MEYAVTTPLTAGAASRLQCGDTVLISGTLYTGRDAAHKRMAQLLSAGKSLPFPIHDAVIYYVGPTPAKPGQVIGSAGPTTSYRMDAYTPQLLSLGLRGMIGKGRRSDEVIAAMKEAEAVYFGAIGGAGALLADCIVESTVIAFDDLGPEAIRRLTVKDFPVVVVIDAKGRNLYEEGPENYLVARTSAR
ncbi:Fe-S-containing hydro-lyase [Clostridia bacterium OttesenSCG-928-O13]|nr:Fe-S-containing hydro-lyase [Clostridia bacterium OttesenSCG-928-O13]